MVMGEMNAGRDLRVSLQVRDNLGLMHDVPATVDTGFQGYLTLPSAITETLELKPSGSDFVVLADGNYLEVALFKVTVVWDGQERTVDAYGMGGIPLVGMALLYGMVGTMHFSDGGPLILFRP